MRAVIRPGRARGEMAAPPSKSMAHRLLICAALAKGESFVRPVDRCEDVLATVDCLTALGADLRWEGDGFRVTGCDPAEAQSTRLFCRESGSTLRFMIPLCLLSGRPMRLAGSETLLNRPLSVYEDICRAQGLHFRREEGELWVEGRLKPGEYAVPGDVSSQFISGLMFALPLLEGDSTLRVLPPVESRPYLNMTLRALMEAGIPARWLDEQTLFLPGNSSYAAREAIVEGDFSNAVFFAALNCLGGDVRLTGLREDSLQGDRIYAQYLPLLVQGCPALDVSNCPDLAPALMAVAAACHGARLTGTRRLRFTESDRGAVMAAELGKFGAVTDVSEDELVVREAPLHAPGAALSSHNDHRVAMALSLLCTRVGGEIEGAQAVRKSLPDYWDRLKALGVEVELREDAHGYPQIKR